LIQHLQIATPAGERGLADTPAPLPLDELVPGDGAWEVEIGFGKGRYLLRRCQEDPDRRFLGMEVAAEYFGMFVEKARRRRLANWIALRGDALALISAVLPHGFASAVHVYYRDIAHGLPLLLQIWLFASPVVYPMSVVPANVLPWYRLNPMALLMEGYRRALLSGQGPDLAPLGVAFAGVLVLLIGAYLFFKRAERTFADVI